eukprot:48080-Eustigmatos_ZCMA.PRE.1
MKAKRKDKRMSCYDFVETEKGLNYILQKAAQFNGKPWGQLQLYGGMVSGTRPFPIKWLVNTFGGTTVLDPTAGWGGRM